MPTRVVVTLIATLLLALSVVFRVWGREPDLYGLDTTAISVVPDPSAPHHPQPR